MGDSYGFLFFVFLVNVLYQLEDILFVCRKFFSLFFNEWVLSFFSNDFSAFTEMAKMVIL